MEGKFFRQRYIALVFTYILCRSDFATEISRLCTVYSKRVVNERHCDVRSESRLGGQGVGRLLGWLPQVGSYRGGRGAGGSGTAPGWPPGG